MDVHAGESCSITGAMLKRMLGWADAGSKALYVKVARLVHSTERDPNRGGISILVEVMVAEHARWV